MKTGVRHYLNASCRISMCDAVPPKMRQNIREITSIDVPENLRRQGMATEMVRNVCDEADAHNVTLVLFVKPFGDTPGPDEDQLAQWYTSKFGFTLIQVTPPMMARMPGSTPQFFKPAPLAFAINKGTFK